MRALTLCYEKIKDKENESKVDYYDIIIYNNMYPCLCTDHMAFLKGKKNNNDTKVSFYACMPSLTPKMTIQVNSLNFE